MTRAPLRASFAALAVLSLAGCGDPMQQPVAQVGPRSVTVEDFVRIARGNESQYPGEAAAAKDSLLRDLMIREAMLVAASGRGLDRHPDALRYRAALEQQAMQRELRDQLAPSDIGVSEAELHEMHRWRSERVHAQIIYSLSQTTIREASRLLAAGDAFEAVADRFNFPGMLGPGGDAGWATPGQLMQPLDDALRELPIGETGGPYRTAQGWFLLRVLDRQPQEQMPFELQRAGLEQLVRQRKQREIHTRQVERIKLAYDVKPVFASTQRVYQIMRDGGRSLQGDPSRETLVVWRGGQYTVADLQQDLDDPNSEKPPASMMPAIEVWLETRALARILDVEARRRHLHESPRVKREVDDQFDNHLTQGLYAEITALAGPVSDADVRAVWERMKDQYIRLEHVDLQWIDVADSALAASIARHGAHAGTLAEAVAMQDATLRVNTERVTFPTPDPRWSLLEAMFIRMQPGEWAGPDRVEGGWRLLMLADKRQVTQDFEQLPPPLRENMVRAAEELKRDRYFIAFADSVQQAVGVKRFPERLAKLPWPLPEALSLRP